MWSSILLFKLFSYLVFILVFTFFRCLFWLWSLCSLKFRFVIHFVFKFSWPRRFRKLSPWFSLCWFPSWYLPLLFVLMQCLFSLIFRNYERRLLVLPQFIFIILFLFFRLWSFCLFFFFFYNLSWKSYIERKI